MSSHNTSVRFDRRSVLKAGGALATTGVLAGCSGDDGSGDGEWPQEDIRWIVPFGPGGTFDTHSRAISQFWPSHLPNDVNVVVENVEGGGGRNGINTVIQSDPDGLTWGMAHLPSNLLQEMFEGAEFGFTELSWLGRPVSAFNILVVRSDLEEQSLEALQNSGKTYRFGSIGVSSMMINIPSLESLGIDYEFVTGYGGSSEVAAALRRGELDMMQTSNTATSLVNGVEDGAFTPVLFFGEEPPEFAADVTTVNDIGQEALSGVSSNHYVTFGPPDIPDDVLSTARDTFYDAVSSDEYANWAEENNRDVTPAHGEDIEELVQGVRDTFEEYRDVIEQTMEEQQD